MITVGLASSATSACVALWWRFNTDGPDGLAVVADDVEVELLVAPQLDLDLVEPDHLTEAPERLGVSGSACTVKVLGNVAVLLRSCRPTLMSPSRS